MRNSPALLAATVLTCSMLPGCLLPPVSSTSGGSTAPASGPGEVVTDATTSTLPARVKAGLAWLWSSYTALKGKGVDVASLKAALVDLEAVVSRGDLGAALGLYSEARVMVGALAQGV